MSATPDPTGLREAVEALASEHEAVMDSILPMPNRDERESGRRLVRGLRALAAHPDPTPEPDAGDVETLANVLLASWKAQDMLHPSLETDRDDARQDARAILASDWLAAHDAEVRRDTAERLNALAETWVRDEDEGIEHVAVCQDYHCRECVVIACATDLRALAREEASR